MNTPPVSRTPGHTLDLPSLPSPTSFSPDAGGQFDSLLKQGVNDLFSKKEDDEEPEEE
jgi:hypothetical protein